MDSQWSQQQNDALFLPSPLSDAYQIDMANYIPFDDTTFPLLEVADSTAFTPPTYTSQSTSEQLKKQPVSPSSWTQASNSPQSIQSALDFDFGQAVSTGPMDSKILPSTTSADDWLLNPTTGEVSLSQDGRDALKRSKNNGDGDAIAACWTSPLCPNKKEDGGRPDQCKGECADFLFAHPSELPDDKKFLSEIMARSEPKVTLDPPSRGLKRSDMDSTPELSSRRSVASSSPDLTGTPNSISAAASSSPNSTPPPKEESTSKKATKTPVVPVIAANTQQAKPKGRVPHNQVEKKYRENVNAQLEALRRVVPVSRQQLVGYDGFDIEDLGANSRQPSKAVVLSSATAYIKQLEKENERMMEEIANLKAQNKTLQSLVKCDDCSLMNYVKRWKIQPGL